MKIGPATRSFCFDVSASRHNTVSRKVLLYADAQFQLDRSIIEGREGISEDRSFEAVQEACESTKFWGRM